MDVVLAGRRLSNVEFADDIMFMRRNKSEAIQQLLDWMHEDWCARKFLLINAAKSFLMIFGKLPQTLPTLRVGETTLSFIDEFKYVGTWITSTHRCIFAPHYFHKASMARSVMYSTFAMESIVGSLPVPEALRLYMARVDPHLISSCEVAVDVDDSLLLELEKVQLEFLRRVLGLHDRSVRAVLFTETGVMPIRYRRITLVLSYIIYVLSLEEDHYARAALEDSVLLWKKRKPCWLGDLQIVLHRLHYPLDLQPQHIHCPTTLSDMIAEVEDSCRRQLYDEIRTSDRTFLLWDTCADDRLQMSSYLRLVYVDAHRVALTRLLRSAHCLAVETLRYKARYRTEIPRHHRLCRFCRECVEDEVHALFCCPGNIDLRSAREEFFKALKAVSAECVDNYMSMDHAEYIRSILADERILLPFARLTFRVLKIYSEHEVFVMPNYVVHATGGGGA